MAGVTLLTNAIVGIVLLLVAIHTVRTIGIRTTAAMLGAGILAIAITFAAVQGLLIANPDLPQEIQQNQNQFQSFCTDLYGDDASVYAGGSMGDHAGLHCSDGPMNEAIHRGQIPDDVWKAYQNDEVSAEYVATHLEPTQGFFNTFLPILLIVLAASVVVTFFGRQYSDKEEVA